MTSETETTCTVFQGTRRVASGALETVAPAALALMKADGLEPVLVFDDCSGRVVDLDLRDPSPVEDRKEAAPSAGKGRGRPKLGVVGREVTLLPRHWDWLAAQPGGASVALRKLIDEARRTSAGADRRRAAQEAAYRVMSALGGDLPGYEDAVRALFAGDATRFAAEIADWPADLRAYVTELAAFEG